jgi:hypothetical protein
MSAVAERIEFCWDLTWLTFSFVSSSSNCMLTIFSLSCHDEKKVWTHNLKVKKIVIGLHLLETINAVLVIHYFHWNCRHQILIFTVINTTSSLKNSRCIKHSSKGKKKLWKWKSTCISLNLSFVILSLIILPWLSYNKSV